ncbi:MAG: cytochrome C oxidase subunit IV family protein [Longimicrobiales bacterium]|jgi:caa(3)-type oxidase subunit IV
MSENNEHNGEHGHDDGHHVNYFKIYLLLLVLFIISVVGPEVGEFTGLRWITLITAFGIAVVKARLVVNNFMHLAWEKRIMKWMLASSVLLMFLMVAGISPDVMNHEGNNWENVAAKAEVERGLAYAAGYSSDEAEDEGEAEVVVAAGFSAATSYGQICATCHGAAGAGDGIAGAALDPPPANFTDPAFWADPARDRDRVITVIRDGAVAVGGSALMAPWGALYTEEQLEQVADYVMSFRPDA